MKITKIKFALTRQVTNFHPMSFEIEADLSPNEDPATCMNNLQEYGIRVAYKDSPANRDSLIKALCTIKDKIELRGEANENLNKPYRSEAEIKKDIFPSKLKTSEKFFTEGDFTGSKDYKSNPFGEPDDDDIFSPGLQHTPK